MRQGADAEGGDHRAHLGGAGKQRRRCPGAVRQERVQEADPEIRDESDADRPEDLRPKDRADGSRQRERDKIEDECGEVDDNRRAFAALERPPDERAHNDDFQSRAQAERQSNVALAAAERGGQHDGKRDGPRNIAV